LYIQAQPWRGRRSLLLYLSSSARPEVTDIAEFHVKEPGYVFVFVLAYFSCFCFCKVTYSAVNFLFLVCFLFLVLS
jgi:hypothetical protein